ncbi:MAG: GlxA family transcriptional regulator [Alphaproteobacteria bacterium]|nr:GlxA family transcriptional regulator [Alphaproteobacteria bacterium]
MPNARKKIVFVAFGGAQVLDITGPFQVFAAANEELETPAYDLTLANIDTDDVSTSAGLILKAESLSHIDPTTVHTVIAVGGHAPNVQAAMKNAAGMEWLQAAARHAERIGSVCTGTFLLAAAGIIDGKRVATHWQAAGALQKHYPSLNVDCESLYVEDGNVWTSAGVTAGIDMALALVERDLGRPLAMNIARRLVIYARRPGNQSQFSTLLESQTKATGPLAKSLDWMAKNIREPVGVADAADAAGMSERSFHRKFFAETGDTPARYMEKLRLEAARTLLESPDLPLKTVAAESGFGTPIRLIQAFERRFGLSPTAYRKLHGMA